LIRIMKHVLTSAGLLALGAATLYGLDPEMTRQQSGRPFSVAATVRGFYDDNINTSPDKIVTTADGVTTTIHPREESIGFQVIPSVHLNLPFEQTYVSLGYVYTLTWYEDREPNEIDQAHEFNAKLRHQFNPRLGVAVDDTFVVTSEPTVVDRFGIITSPVRTRTRSSVLHNYGAIEGNIGLTRLLALSLGYANHWYDYEAEGIGSRSALLDRLEHLIRADARFQFSPKLVGVVGYSFGFTTYNGDEFLVDPETTFDDAGNPVRIKGDVRDSIAHYIYVGAEYDITAKLRASVRVGAQFSSYDDLDQSSANPYADASVNYTIISGTTVEVGVRHARNATDVSAVDTRTGRPTLDAETTAVYGQFQHRITRKLTGSVIGQFQHSVYNDGENDGETEDLFLVGVNLGYSFNRHWSAEVGYNYDQLFSHLNGFDRSYDRNRVYVGVTARY
jgi:hypothetical protein